MLSSLFSVFVGCQHFLASIKNILLKVSYSPFCRAYFIQNEQGSCSPASLASSNHLILSHLAFLFSESENRWAWHSNIKRFINPRGDQLSNPAWPPQKSVKTNESVTHLFTQLWNALKKLASSCGLGVVVLYLCQGTLGWVKLSAPVNPATVILLIVTIARLCWTLWF